MDNEKMAAIHGRLNAIGLAQAEQEDRMDQERVYVPAKRKVVINVTVDPDLLDQVNLWLWRDEGVDYSNRSELVRVLLQEWCWERESLASEE